MYLTKKGAGRYLTKNVRDSPLQRVPVIDIAPIVKDLMRFATVEADVR